MKYRKDNEAVKNLLIGRSRKGLRRKAPKWQYPAALQRKYMSMLASLVNVYIEAVEKELIAALPLIVAEEKASRMDSWVDRLERAVSVIGFQSTGFTQNVRQMALDLGQDVGNFNKSQLNRIMASTLGVNVSKQEPWFNDEIRSWASENAKLITSLPQQSLTQIEGMAQRGVRSGASVADITKEIQNNFNATKARARLIARDQIAKLNADLTEKRQTGIGIKYYAWASSRDERVRHSHEVLDGKLCRWDDDSVYSDDEGATWLSRESIGGYVGHAGTDYQCRCDAIPEVGKLLDELGL